jgi:cytoskeletal protein CcmA (bactofilin family)
MLFKGRTLIASLLSLALLLSVSVLPVAAADFRAGDQVTIAAGETISEDVYVAAGTSLIEGTIEGDLLVAGGVVDVRGNVTGSVNVAGGNVLIDGEVGGAVRVMGGNVTIAGQVGRDVVVAGGNVLITHAAAVAGDVAGGVGRLEIAGAVNGDVLAGTGDLIIRGSIGGDVDAEVGQLRIEPGANISGSVRYGSEREAHIAQDAQIGGTVQRDAPRFVADRPLIGDNPLTAFLGGLLALLLVGWGLLALRPAAVVAPATFVRRQPMMSVGAGLATWFGQFVLIILLIALAAAFGQLASSLGGAFVAPIVLLVLALLAAIVLAQVWVAMAIGDLIATRTGPLSVWLSYAIGALVWALVLTALGYLAGVLGGVAFLLGWIVGLGALALYVVDMRRREAAPAVPEPAGPARA